MKTAIVYYSRHHENTKALIDAIARVHQVTLIDATSVQETDLSQYDLIGGMAKGHPTDDEVAGAVKFFDSL